MKLLELLVGQRARVVGYERSRGMGHYRQKLLALGLTPQTLVQIQRVAPMGDPIQLRVRGAELSLRKQEAAIVDVEVCE